MLDRCGTREPSTKWIYILETQSPELTGPEEILEVTTAPWLTDIDVTRLLKISPNFALIGQKHGLNSRSGSHFCALSYLMTSLSFCT